MSVERKCAQCAKLRTVALENHGWLCKPCFRVQKYAKKKTGNNNNQRATTRRKR